MINANQPIPAVALKHLHGSMQFSARNGKGNCFQRSAALALDLSGSEIVFGTLRAANLKEVFEIPGASLEPFIHAWVEWRGFVYAPTTVERANGMLVPFEQQDYYQRNGATNIRRLPRAEFERIARRFRLSAAFRHAKQRAGDGEITTAMLDAAGVRWKLSENRSVMPAWGD